jgi:alcohol dehydrogenase (NADP+)
MRTTTGWVSIDDSSALQRASFERRDLRDDDIAVRIDYCGVCHSDLHVLNGVHGTRDGILVPGHEFTGTVTGAGPAVTRFSPGDQVAVGTIVDSCGACARCQAGEETYCTEFPVITYAGTDRVDGTRTQGGYSREYVLREKFAYPLPDGLDPAAAAPLMCAGVTVWDALRTAEIGKGSQVAVAGLGGLGHLAVKFAAARGAEVTVLSRTADKAGDALKLGAAGLLVTTDDQQLEEAKNRFDLILDTISAPHDLAPLLSLLTVDGTLSLLGALGEATLPVMLLTLGRRTVTSSATGGRAATAEMLAFAAEHGITADVEVLPSAQVQQALTRLDKGDVRYRFVLDLSDLD